MDNEEKKTISIRLIGQMRSRMVDKAKENGRSLSGEIVYRLKKSLEQEDEQIKHT